MYIVYCIFPDICIYHYSLLQDSDKAFISMFDPEDGDAPVFDSQLNTLNTLGGLVSSAKFLLTSLLIIDS